MNRRSFFRSLLALPAGLKAAAVAASGIEFRREGWRPIIVNGKPMRLRGPEIRYISDKGIKAMLARTNREQPDFYCSPEQARQLNEIFAKLYAVRTKEKR